jgi:hypothetical protein
MGRHRNWHPGGAFKPLLGLPPLHLALGQGSGLAFRSLPITMIV